MNKNWMVGAGAGFMIVGILIVWIYKAKTDAVPLTDIFPEESETSSEIEYELADQNEPVEPQAPAAAPIVTREVEPVAQVQPVQQPVKATVPVPAPAAQNVPAAPAMAMGQGDFTIQVASFKEKSKAEILLNNLKAEGYPAYLAQRDLGEKGLYFRIYVGKFQSKNEANDLLSKIKTSHKDSFVTSSPN